MKTALRLRVENLEPKEEGRSSVREISYAATSGARHTGKTSRRNPAVSLGLALVARPFRGEQEKHSMCELEVQIG
jgi:hypothetical protein